jgi:hypothetical protein
MPIFVLAARLCPKGMEATMYATIMSFLNLGGVVSVQLGANSYFVLKKQKKIGGDHARYQYKRFETLLCCLCNSRSTHKHM